MVDDRAASGTQSLLFHAQRHIKCLLETKVETEEGLALRTIFESSNNSELGFGCVIMSRLGSALDVRAYSLHNMPVVGARGKEPM